MIISWDKPERPRTIDHVLAHVMIEHGGHIHGRLKIDQDQPFPRQMTVKLPEVRGLV